MLVSPEEENPFEAVVEIPEVPGLVARSATYLRACYAKPGADVADGNTRLIGKNRRAEKELGRLSGCEISVEDGTS
eukprot:1552094-Rhodomonas_salina.1